MKTNYNKSNITCLIILIFSLSCVPILYESKFIDIESTKLIKIDMTIQEIKLIIGEPNYVELKTDEIEDELVVHCYYIRDKVYLHSVLPRSNNVISENNLNSIVGYGDERKFILYYNEGLLFKTEVEQLNLYNK